MIGVGHVHTNIHVLALHSLSLPRLFSFLLFRSVSLAVFLLSYFLAHARLHTHTSCAGPSVSSVEECEALFLMAAAHGRVSLLPSLYS